MMLGSLGMLWRQRDQFESYILNTLIVSIIFAVLAELAFTFYSNMYDLYTLLGHILKLFSFYLIYKAIVVTGFTRPFDLLSKDLILKERMLTEEKERFKELFKNTSVGNIIIKVTGDGTKFVLEDMNLASETFISFHRDEILGKDLNDIYNDEFERELIEAIHQVWLTGKSMKIAEFYYHNNSIESWWELFIYKLSSGEIVIVSKDITLNKKLEKSQEELNEMLNKS
jgi:PAS domain-containing protein